ncbi:MAG: hypothetical protein ACJ77Z_12785 [Thermoleophilaceae bacterium]
MTFIRRPKRVRGDSVSAMESGFPRPLTKREHEMLDLFLAQEFQGVEALREQARSVRVRGLHNGLEGVVLLGVQDDNAPRARVPHTIPVETRVRDAEPPQEVLLFVKEGLLNSIEVVDYSGGEPDFLPGSRRSKLRRSTPGSQVVKSYRSSSIAAATLRRDRAPASASTRKRRAGIG